MSRTEGSVDQSTNKKQTESFRRGIRAGYQAIHNRINEGKDEIASLDSPMFKTIFKDVEKLHQHVIKPREQVLDAEVMLNLTSTLLTSAKSFSLGAFTPSEFVSSLLRQFPGDSRRRQSGNAADLVCWKAIGLAAAPIFKKGKGCRTMIGPMDLKLKPRKYIIFKSSARKITGRERPKEVNSSLEKKTQTDMDMAVMFGILKKRNRVKLENLILNRHSFAQTVENLFALSFLVRDGRVVVEVDDNGSHLVSPRNAPNTYLVVRGEVNYSHFIFRLDFADWKLMMDLVPEGEELMPHRQYLENKSTSEAAVEEEFETKDILVLSDTPPVLLNNPGMSEEEYELKVFEMATDRTPGLDSSSKHGQFLLEKSMAEEDMPEAGRASDPKCKRKLF